MSSRKRARLIRRLERLATGKPDLGDVNTIARALWHKRHPELLPVVRRSLATLALSELSSLGGTVNREASYYCERLFILLLRHREHLIPLLPPERRAELREVARRRVEAFALHDGSLRAAVLLQYVGLPEDVDFLLAHRPAEPILAKVFDDAVAALRSHPAREP